MTKPIEWTARELTSKELFAEKFPMELELLDWSKVEVPYYDDDISFEINSNEIFWSASIHTQHRVIEAINRELWVMREKMLDAVRIMRQAEAEVSERLDYVYKNIAIVTNTISMEAKKHVESKYPLFMDIIVKDNDARKKLKQEEFEKKMKEMKEQWITTDKWSI